MTKQNSDLESQFKDKSLYELALTHKSWVNEHKGKRESNERLEFLGDAVLEFVVSKELFGRFPDKEEGYLTALRSNLVNTLNLATLARKLNIGEKLCLSKGEEESGGRKNPSLLANTVEAIIGAMYIDSGVETAEAFIKENILNHLEEKINGPLKDAKSRLQEYVQSLGHHAPKYLVVEETGPDHDKRFTIEVVVEGKTLSTGSGKNKSEAAQDAANNALSKLNLS